MQIGNSPEKQRFRISRKEKVWESTQKKVGIVNASLFLGFVSSWVIDDLQLLHHVNASSGIVGLRDETRVSLREKEKNDAL